MSVKVAVVIIVDLPLEVVQGMLVVLVLVAWGWVVVLDNWGLVLSGLSGVLVIVEAFLRGGPRRGHHHRQDQSSGELMKGKEEGGGREDGF